MVEWLRHRAHDQEVVSLIPGTLNWTDVSNIASCYIKRKIKNKLSQLGHIKKIFKKESGYGGQRCDLASL